MKWVYIVLFSFVFMRVSAQYKNLVLEGGGIRGIAYVGAVKALENEDLLAPVENIGGTSVGGITAALLCVGYTSEELEAELTSLKFQRFNDGRGIFIGGMQRTRKQYGWYRGEELTEWMDALLFKKTGIHDLSFETLHCMSDTSTRYKNLVLMATNLSLQRPEILSVATFPKMRIADAVRVSASIPLYFTAVFMDVEGNLYSKPPKYIATYVLSDGGFLTNYPIHLFDGTYGISETLGLRLDEEAQIKNDTSQISELAPYPIETTRDYVGALYNLVIENLNRCELTPEDWDRTVSISTCGIGPKIKRLKASEVEQLREAGYTAVQVHLSARF